METFIKTTFNKVLLLIACLHMGLLVALDVQAQQTDVKAIALFNGKAMLAINGNKAKILKEGETVYGVTLLSSSTESAQIKVGDSVESIVLNGSVLLDSSLAQKPLEKEFIQLWSDDSGFFFARGNINGRSARFLVDTGANLVVFSSQQANQLGIEYENGRKSFASTASGVAPMYAISIDQLSIDGLTLRNIDAGVIVGGFPQVPLLGMSFLGQLNMQRTGNQMVLRKR
jgi:aspartyl protease family protein